MGTAFIKDLSYQNVCLGVFSCTFVQANETRRGGDSFINNRYDADGQLLDLN